MGCKLSNSRDGAFCIRALQQGQESGRGPLISNCNQGRESSSEACLDVAKAAGVDGSMDGRGRWLDKRFNKPLWRSVKGGVIYVQD